MKLKTGNPRVRGPRKAARTRDHERTNVEPSTFAWFEPLADVEPVVVERRVVVERDVEKQIVVEKLVDREVIVEKQVFIEKPVVVEKQVFVDKPVVVEKKIFVDRPVIVQQTAPDDGSADAETPAVEKPAVAANVADKPAIEPAAVAAAPKRNHLSIFKLGKFAGAKQNAAQSRREAKPKAIIIGRGPTFFEKLIRFSPNPKPVLVGATALLIAIGGVAMISPSGDNATAARSSTPFGAADSGAGAGATPATIAEQRSRGNTSGKSRDPFAAQSFKSPPKPNGKAANANAAAQQKKAGSKATAKSAVKPPAVATPSLFVANFTTYSSYTPWSKSQKRSGGWVDFGGKPTVKVIAVGKNGADLFVVTDVEVITDKSKNIKYDNPMRTIHVGPGGVVRFADYRDIQGEDVTYTIRFRGSQTVKSALKK